MQIVERHVIKPNHPYYAEIDAAAFASKNLYNAANYILRQRFINESKYTGMKSLYHEIKFSEAYTSLPRKVSNDVLRQLLRDWKSYREACKAYKKDPSKFLGHPKLPKYKHKTDGRNILIYDIQALSKPLLRDGIVKPTALSICINTQQENIVQARIVPKKTHYVFEVVYKVEPEPAQLDYTLVAGLDLGLNNLASIASNKADFQPVIVNGRPLKAFNQFYNKRKAELQSILGSEKATSKQIAQLTNKRNGKVTDYLHKASRWIVDHLTKHQIGTLIIGLNDDWKQSINIGKRNNQNFVQIPHARFIDMLKYKCQLIGINLITTEESYTSKTSFLDGEMPVKQSSYVGRRIARGLFRSSMGRKINADINAAAQIIRKVFPNAFKAEGIEGVAVRPLRWSIPVA